MANTVFEHLGQHDGLPHAIATGVTEDAQGYLWASTQDGVARWDGYRFRVYPARPDDPHGLPVSYVRTIATTALGRIWVGMDGGGLARFDTGRELVHALRRLRPWSPGRPTPKAACGPPARPA